MQRKRALSVGVEWYSHGKLYGVWGSDPADFQACFDRNLRYRGDVGFRHCEVAKSEFVRTSDIVMNLRELSRQTRREEEEEANTSG